MRYGTVHCLCKAIVEFHRITQNSPHLLPKCYPEANYPNDRLCPLGLSKRPVLELSCAQR